MRTQKNTILNLIQVIGAFYLFLSISACENENENIEGLNLMPQGECMVSSIEGLTMKFCLLDSYGNPKTTFEENENIIFILTLSNESRDTIVVAENLIDQDFFKVIGESSNTDYGKPYTGVWCEFINAPKEIRIDPKQSFDIICPWIKENGISVAHPLCKSVSNEYLPKGNYHTGYDTNFNIMKSGRIIQIGGSESINLLFTIN